MNSYPKPDWRHFLKTTGGMALFLALLHWAPEVAAWIHGHFFGETLVLDGRSFRAVLGVAYAMCSIAFVISASGIAWAWWHHRRT